VTDTVAKLGREAAPECFALLPRCQGVAVDPAQIRHRFGGATIGIAEMLRSAQDFNFKARLTVADWPRLAKLALPAIAECNDGGFMIVARVADETAVVRVGGRPRLMRRSQLQAFCKLFPWRRDVPYWVSVSDLRAVTVAGHRPGSTPNPIQRQLPGANRDQRDFRGVSP